MKRYLVTGGAGFVGSHLVDYLLSRGHTVRVLDNFSTGKRERIPNGVEIVEADIRDQKAIASAFVGVDGVFHLAALPSVQVSLEHPEETHAVNVTGTVNVLLASRDARVPRIVYAASCAAYGDQATLPCHEGMTPHPNTPYALQKYIGEQYVQLFSTCYGLQTVALRFFNIYGPQLPFHGAYASVIGIFLKQQSSGQALTITGDGKQTRDFVYVEDIVRALLAAMESPHVGTGEVINIGSGVETSVNAVADLFGGQREYIAPRVELRAIRANIDRANTLLGWSPEISFADGMQRTMEWFARAMPSQRP
ncbi:NAD-dependent epimerase/dehydratase family protein [Candidatus Uhrbacteria bacterium]|nr:NAD-dependent epimerase/dehydratase family protein [Candidatus Uhrbacteria bacterium]